MQTIAILLAVAIIAFLAVKAAPIANPVPEAEALNPQPEPPGDKDWTQLANHYASNTNKWGGAGGIHWAGLNPQPEPPKKRDADPEVMGQPQ